MAVSRQNQRLDPCKCATSAKALLPPSASGPTALPAALFCDERDEKVVKVFFCRLAAVE